MIPQSKKQTSTVIAHAVRCTLRAVAILGLVLGASDWTALAQNGFPPDRMSYQGYLVDANGAALASTSPVNYSVVFRIYSVSTGGTSLWTENQTVTVDKGNFSVVLGEGGVEGSEVRPALSTVFNSATASDLYLGITVKGLSGNNSEILPRLRLLTSPYAFLARTANSLAGSDGASLITSDAGRLRISQSLQTTGGNARGANAVDLQTARSASSPGQVASGANSVIVGGQNNTASQGGAVVVGGTGNTASGWWSFIGSGENNVASGNYSVIPAGQNNEASGHFSFASGRRAKAKHTGSVVFGDFQDSDKQSTADNQFLVYASGGVGINTTPASGSALTVSGKAKADSGEFGPVTVSTLTASSTISGFGTIPLGGIIMWSGSVDSIPSGWILCNGQSSNGRTSPDLRGRFIIGAGAGASGLTSRNVGETGGTETQSLTVNQMPAHNHNVSGTTSENGNHQHSYLDIYYSECCPNNGWMGSGKTDWDNGPQGTWRTTEFAGSHTHTFNVTSGTTGSGEAFSKLPPFYALAFIMRVQ